MAKKDDNSEIEDDFADESNANKDSEGSDNEEPEDDGSKTVDDFQGKAFDISRTVNLESEDLADVLLRKTHQCQGKPLRRRPQPLLPHQKSSQRRIGRCSEYILLP